MSMNQIANELNISNGALTGHIKKLEECGLISASNDSSGHGNQKLCSLIQDRILVEIEKPIDLSNVYNTSIKGRAVFISQYLSNLWPGYILICDRRAR